MTKTLHKLLLLFALTWSLVLQPEYALAQGTASLTCGAGGTVASGVFFNDTDGQDGSACQFANSGSLKHIFSDIICNFVQMLNSVLSKVYCGMQDLLKTLVGAVLTLYVAIFGAQMLVGMADATAKEFVTRMLKIAFVWVFVSQSVWAVHYAFLFFVTLAGQGVEWVMASIPNPMAGGLGPLPPSGFSPSAICMDPVANTATGFMAAFIRLDVVICEAVTGPLVLVNSKLIGFLFVICLLAPQIGALAISWLLLNLKILVQGLVTFLLGIAAIAFLIAMAPIFLSMMLFKATAGFFENWLKYLMSFSLQIILVFACIALWLTVTVNFISFFSNLSDTIFADQTVNTRSQAQNISDSWGVCPFNYYPTAPAGSPPGPFVECQDPNFDPATSEADKDKVIPISALLWAKVPGGGPADDSCNYFAPIPFAVVNDCTKFLYYIIYHFITLIIVTFAFEALLREAPLIAVYLAGPDYSPPLTGSGGFGVSRAGQIRSLFTSGGGDRGSGEGGFSLRRLTGDLFGSNSADELPGNRPSEVSGGGARATDTVDGAPTRAPTITSASRNPTQEYRERLFPPPPPPTDVA
jgi:type IV secretory pathway VirB6-like protein